MKSYRPQTWVHPDVQAWASTIHGNGLFAQRDFAADDVICVVGGVPMTDGEFAAFQQSCPLFNALQIDENLHLVEDPNLTRQLDASLNHHCNSNLWMIDEAALTTRYEIEAGTELTVDYALFTTSPEWNISPCNCGATSCRSTPCGTDWKRPAVRRRYAGHFSPFLNRRIERSLEADASVN